MTRFILTAFLLQIVSQLFAQQNVADTNIRFVAISGEIGMHYPGGDLAKRFGGGGVVGGALMYKTKSNITFEGNYGFLFGNQVKEDTILKPLFTEQGYLIGKDGYPAEVLIFQRGFVSTLRIGKIFPVIGPNPNCGIHAAIGGGMMYHKIRIQNFEESVPQIQGDYVKGYDRQTFGFTLSQSLGYQHFSSYRFFNFYTGVELYEGFTKNRRSVNFDTGLPDNSARIDILATLVLRWYFPIYKRQPKEFYFY